MLDHLELESRQLLKALGLVVALVLVRVDEVVEAVDDTGSRATGVQEDTGDVGIVAGVGLCKVAAGSLDVCALGRVEHAHEGLVPVGRLFKRVQRRLVAHERGHERRLVAWRSRCVDARSLGLVPAVHDHCGGHARGLVLQNDGARLVPLVADPPGRRGREDEQLVGQVRVHKVLVCRDRVDGLVDKGHALLLEMGVERVQRPVTGTTQVDVGVPADVACLDGGTCRAAHVAHRRFAGLDLHAHQLGLETGLVAQKSSLGRPLVRGLDLALGREQEVVHQDEEERVGRRRALGAEHLALELVHGHSLDELLQDITVWVGLAVAK